MVLVAVTGLMWSVSARPRGAAEGREAREREARKACFTGNVDRGVEILVDLYGETRHPNYIYNQARCFERNGKYDQALLSYEDYLRKAKDLGETRSAPRSKNRSPSCAPRWRRADVGRGAAPRRRRAGVAVARLLACAGHRRRVEPGAGRARCRRDRTRRARRGLAVAADGGRRLAGRRGWRRWRWASRAPCCARAAAATSTTSAYDTGEPGRSRSSPRDRLPRPVRRGQGGGDA